MSTPTVPPSPSTQAPVDSASTSAGAIAAGSSAPPVVVTPAITARKVFTREAHQLLRSGALVSGAPLASELSSINAVPVVKHAKHAIVISTTVPMQTAAGQSKPQPPAASRSVANASDEQRSDNERPSCSAGNTDISSSDASRGAQPQPTSDVQTSRQPVVSSGATTVAAAAASSGGNHSSSRGAVASEGSIRGTAPSNESPPRHSNPPLSKAAVETLGSLRTDTLPPHKNADDSTDSDDDTLQYANSAVASFTVPLLSQSERDSLATLQKQFQAYQAVGQQRMTADPVAPTTPTKSVFGSLPTGGAVSVSVFAAQTASQSTATPQPLLSSPQAKLLQSVLASSRVAQASASGGSPRSSLHDGNSPGSAGEQSPPDALHPTADKVSGEEDGVPGVFLDSLLNAIRSRKDAEAAGSSTKASTTTGSSGQSLGDSGGATSSQTASGTSSKKLSADAPAFKPKFGGAALSVGYSPLPLSFEMFAALNALGLLPPLTNAMTAEPDPVVVYEHDEVLMRRIEQQIIASRGSSGARGNNTAAQAAAASSAQSGTVGAVWDEQAWSSFDRRFLNVPAHLASSAANKARGDADIGQSGKKKRRTRRSKRRKNRRQGVGDDAPAGADGGRLDEDSSGSSSAEEDAGGGEGDLRPHNKQCPSSTTVETTAQHPPQIAAVMVVEHPQVHNPQQTLTGPTYVEDDEG